MLLADQAQIGHRLRRTDFAACPEESEQGVAGSCLVIVEDLLNFRWVADTLALLPHSARYMEDEVVKVPNDTERAIRQASRALKG